MDNRNNKLICHSHRQVLFLNLCHTEMEWHDHFADIGWRSICVLTLADAREALLKEDIDVAVAAISSASQYQVYSGLMTLLGFRKHVVWIALSCDGRFPEYRQTQKHPCIFFDYHHLPVDWSRLAHTLGHAQGMAALRKNSFSQNRPPESQALIHGGAKVIRNLNMLLEKIAAVDATALICGETGSGKGVCAQWIHEHSARANGPFVIVNCAALPTNLIHSELFGFEKGAFTGAAKRHIGYLEQASHGTLFLDEIGDLNIESQINLLRFLEDNTIERLGSSSRIEVDCRILFATHVDIEQAIDKGLFREDLYHRMNILRIQVPALRERKEDIEMLANGFLQSFQPEDACLSFSESALTSMYRYNWPGNVRELKNRVLRAVVLTDGEMITEKELGIELSVGKATGSLRANHAAQQPDAEALLAVLRKNNNNISAAARELQISRTTFYKLIKKCNIRM